MQVINQTPQSNWQALCGNSKYRDLPCRIETDRRGKIIMTPTRMKHGKWQYLIAKILEEKIKVGEVLVECAIKTSNGTKVADVAWYSKERWQQVEDDFDAAIAAEICIEILSSGNTDKEMAEKKILFFEKGAQEVWLCDTEGNMSFYNSTDTIGKSSMVEDFPKKIQ